jgi:branched-chain amino acid aminotransferase
VPLATRPSMRPVRRSSSTPQVVSARGQAATSFLVFGDTIITPPLSSGPLAGITRELIMEWSSVEERDLSLEEAKRADEVFLTSSMRDVQAVTGWDDRDFGPTRPVTQAVAINFTERSAADLDP